MMSTFPNCVDTGPKWLCQFSRRADAEILDLLSCDLATSKDQSYRAESEW